MIVITGAAGFIGSCLLGQLNKAGIESVAIVDDFSRRDKAMNLHGKQFVHKIDRGEFSTWLYELKKNPEMVFHLGARTDTTEFNTHIFEELNTGFSRRVWNICAQKGIPLVYASSAATYGLGELGYEDSHSLTPRLKPLNPYGESKNDFDKWALQQSSSPPFWAGIKFFNVYGPNEYHKSRMASVILHAFRQIQENGQIKLFRSHRNDFKDGMQSRDFIYVKDVVQVLHFMMVNQVPNGLYNLGTGKARPFIDLANAVFNAMQKPVNIEFIDTPADIRDKYQYFTQAPMHKLHDAGYAHSFSSLEDGVTDYVQNYLMSNTYY